MPELQHYRHLSLIAAMALFMQSLDATILNTALPAISADLHESPLEMQMAIISYSLTVALFIPLTGWIADKYGTLNVFRVAVAIFVLGSVACAASNSLNALIWSRVARAGRCNDDAGSTLGNYSSRAQKSIGRCMECYGDGGIDWPCARADCGRMACDARQLALDFPN